MRPWVARSCGGTVDPVELDPVESDPVELDPVKFFGPVKLDCIELNHEQ